MFVDEVSTSSGEEDEMNGKGSASLSQNRMLETGVVDTTYAQRTVWLVKVHNLAVSCGWIVRKQCNFYKQQFNLGS